MLENTKNPAADGCRRSAAIAVAAALLTGACAGGQPLRWKTKIGRDHPLLARSRSLDAVTKRLRLSVNPIPARAATEREDAMARVVATGRDAVARARASGVCRDAVTSADATGVDT